MGPYLAVNAVLIGAFGFAAIYHFVLWSQSRREIVLLVFAIHCLICTAVSADFLALAAADTPLKGQQALDARIDLAALGGISSVWVLSLVADVRARWYLWAATAFFAAALIVNLAVVPLAGTVTRVDQVVTSFGDRLAVLHRDSPSRLLILAYIAFFSINVFGFLCAYRLWSRERLDGLLLAVANAAGVALGLWALRIDTAGAPQPYLGNLNYSVWVLLVAAIIAREYRLRAERLAAIDHRCRAIFEQTFELMGMTTIDGVLLDVNTTALAFAGIRKDAVIGKPLWETPWWAHSERLRERLRQGIASAAAGETVRFETTHLDVHATLRDIDFSIKPVRDEHGAVMLLIPEGRDITERKNAQRELEESREELQRLADGLLMAREDERTSIAREVHDVLGQALTALKMDTGWIRARVSDLAPEIRPKLTAMAGLIDEIVATVRRIATDLRPGVLDDFGLAAAIRWQAQEFELRTGIQCTLTDHMGDAVLDPLVSTALFRILQEALTNVARHSAASSVTIMLEQSGDDLILEVRDNGVGIPAGHASDAHSIGLAGMRERAQLVGGSFSVSRGAGAGTVVRVEIPSRETALL